MTTGLATVLVGADPASHKYVSMKRKACAEAGIESFHRELPADATQEDVIGFHPLNIGALAMEGRDQLTDWTRAGTWVEGGWLVRRRRNPSTS